jgi:alkyl sulfatase
MSATATIAPPALDVRLLTGRIGAEVSGINLSGDLNQPTVKAIEQALYRHKILFFRGRHHLDEAGQVSFAKLLGDVVPHPTVPSLEGTDYILDIDGAHHGDQPRIVRRVTLRGPLPVSVDGRTSVAISPAL